VRLPDDSGLCSSSPLDGVLQLSAAACLVVASPFLLALLLLTVVLVPLAACLPLIEPLLRLRRGEVLPPLSAALSLAYLICVGLGAVLLPRVMAFQRARVELSNARGFPDPFYCADVAAIVAARCEVAVQAAATYSRRGAAPPQLRFGDDCTVCLQKIATSRKYRKHTAELPCGHSFHRSCIEEWLRVSHICPNCRAPARLEDLGDRAPLPDSAWPESENLPRLRARETRMW